MNISLKTLDIRSALIGGLLVSAVALSALLLESPQPAIASEVASSRDYQLVTFRNRDNSDGLFILDNRTQLVALFTWDPQAKGILPRDVKSLDQMGSAIR